MLKATFFIGITINVKSRADKWLKGLLMVHGVFFISSFFVPMFGVFNRDMYGADWIGTLILEV